MKNHERYCAFRVGLDGGRVPADVEAAIRRARGGGQPLECGLQAKMSGFLGHDFSGVRIHTGPAAGELNRRLSARAFTVGRDIFFEEGAYDPESVKGWRLIVHELVHVAQQSKGCEGGERSGWTVGPAYDDLEQEAETLAAEVVRAGSARRIPAGAADRSGVIQRTAASCASSARNGMDGWTSRYRPTTCNEAALGWVLKGMGMTHPWQLMRQLAANCTPPFAANVSAWLWRFVYQAKNQVRRGHITNPPTLRMVPPLTPGDILVTEGQYDAVRALHSMVIVAVHPHVAVRGFNNMGTFQRAGGKYDQTSSQYDNFDLEIDDVRLWNNATGWANLFGAQTGRPLYRVQFVDAANQLNTILGVRGGHWTYSFFRTPGWRHDTAPACHIADCPPDAIRVS